MWIISYFIQFIYKPKLVGLITIDEGKIWKVCCFWEVCHSGIETVCGLIDPTPKPYLSYIIRISTTRLHTHKLSEKQISLYQKICDLRFDENLWRKDVARRLNEEGWTSSKGKKNTASTVCSTYFKIRKHFERKHKYLPPDLDDVKLIWE